MSEELLIGFLSFFAWMGLKCYCKLLILTRQPVWFGKQSAVPGIGQKMALEHAFITALSWSGWICVTASTSLSALGTPGQYGKVACLGKAVKNWISVNAVAFTCPFAWAL